MNDELEITEEILTPPEECEYDEFEVDGVADALLFLICIPVGAFWCAGIVIGALLRRLNPWSKRKS